MRKRLVAHALWPCCCSGELYYHLVHAQYCYAFSAAIAAVGNILITFYDAISSQFGKCYAPLHHSHNVLSFLWQCHTRRVTWGPLMSTRALSLPAVMTTGRLSFTRFLRWPRSSYKVNTGQTNERMPCVELHSATLVCGLLPLTNLIPQPFASCVGWTSPTCY